MSSKYYGFCKGESFETAKAIHIDEGLIYRSIDIAVNETQDSFGNAEGIYVEHFDGSVEHWNLKKEYVGSVLRSHFDRWYEKTGSKQGCLENASRAAMRIAFNAGLNCTNRSK